MNDSAYRSHIAAALSANSVEIADRWLQKLKDVVFESPWDVFPSDLYLDHVPSMIDQIGSIVGDPDEELALTNSIITRKAMQLGKLRYEQDASVNQLLREYDILALLLEQFIVDETGRWEGAVSPGEGMHLLSTISRVVRGILQATVDTFVEDYLDQIKRTTENLTSFNSFVSHELRSPLQAALLNVELLMEERDLLDDDMQGLMATRSSIEQASSMLSNLQTPVHRPGVAKVESELNSQRVDVSALARDIASQLQDSMQLRSVSAEIDDDIGTVCVETPKLKLILANLLSNSIKYSDPQKADRRVHIRKQGSGDDESIVFVVEDNGLGIDEAEQKKVFDLRFRAHEEHDEEHEVDGHGIGLHLVAEAVRDIGGSITLASIEGEGTCVSLRVPRQEQMTRKVT